MVTEQSAKCPQARIQKCLQGDEKILVVLTAAICTSSAFCTFSQTVPLQSFLYFPFFYFFPRSNAPFFADKCTRFLFFHFQFHFFLNRSIVVTRFYSIVIASQRYITTSVLSSFLIHFTSFLFLSFLFLFVLLFLFFSFLSCCLAFFPPVNCHKSLSAHFL